MSIHERLGNKIKTLKEKRKSGFTLPELVVTILIIALLFVIIAAGSSIWVAKGKEAGVETDLHTFYVGAKSAILVGDEEALSSKDNFIDLMNEYLDPQMQVQSDYVTTAKDDPWKQTYEFRWNSREGADGRTEYWLAFISEGVGSRPGWVFEPDKPVPDSEKQYYIPSEYRTETLATRAANNTKEWRYIELLGYYGNGSLIDSMTDPDNNGIEDDIKWVITGDSSVTEWAYLSFYVDEDDIEVDADEVSNDTYVSEINNNKTPGGVGGSGVDRRGSMGIIRDVLRGGITYKEPIKGLLKNKSYAYLQEDLKGNLESDGLYYAPSYRVPVIEDDNASQDDVNGILGGNGSYIRDSEVVDNRRKVVVNVGNGNEIHIYFDEADKMPNANWFKVGSDVEIHAVPATDWEFKYWTIDGAKDENNPYQLSPVTKDTVFIAKFRLKLRLSNGKMVTPDGRVLSDYVDEQKEDMNNIIEKYMWSYEEDGSNIKLVKYYGQGGEDITLEIPTALDGKTVSSVEGTKATNGLAGKTFKEVIIPSGVKVGNESFYGSTITNLNINDNVYLGSKAFTGSTIDNLAVGKEVIIDSNTSKETSFSCCGGETKIKNIEIDSDVPAYAFKKVNASKVTIGLNVKNIGNEAFSENVSLKTIIYK